MPGRHRSAGLLRPRSARVPVVIAAAAAAATAAVLVLQSLPDAGGCSSADGVRLPVAADPAIAPVLREVAADWIAADQPEIDGRCVAVDVAAGPTADVAGALAQDAGGFLDVAATPGPGAAGAAVVWVPDSSYWIARTRAVSRNLFAPGPSPLATSPVVLAATPAGAELVGAGPIEPADLRDPVLAAVAARQRLPVAIAEPRRDTAGLVGAGWLQAAVVTAEQELPNAVAVYRGLGRAPADTATVLAGLDAGATVVPVSEQAVIAYNRNAPDPVTAVPVAGAPALDFPYAVITRAPRDMQAAAGRFRAALVSSPEVFARHGFRAPDGSAGTGFPGGGGFGSAPVPVTPVGPPELVEASLRIWVSATRDARVLSVVNVSSSMDEPMAGDEGPSRMEVFRAAAQQGMPLFTDGTDLGQWEYAVGLDGDRNWVEGVPMATLTPEHRARVESAVGSVDTVPTDRAAMFETMLAAYQELKEGHDPSRSNTLIMWTDGGGRPGGLSLEETLRELERLADVTRPIRVILLGLGQDADMEQLTALAQATGGGAFHIQDPDEIALVFLRALLT